MSFGMAALTRQLPQYEPLRKNSSKECVCQQVKAVETAAAAGRFGPEAVVDVLLERLSVALWLFDSLT